MRLFGKLPAGMGVPRQIRTYVESCLASIVNVVKDILCDP